MFNDRFLLTQAVLERRKRQTRRLERGLELLSDINHVFDGEKITLHLEASCHSAIIKPRYKIGEIVAVAQSYKDAGVVGDTTLDYPFIFDEDDAGYLNKMFIKPALMPRRIKMTNRRLQRLQEITDEECLLEGIEKEARTDGKYNYIFFDAKRELYIKERTPRDAYARLIDALSGKGTWESNPYVFAYDFDLIK